MNGPDKSGTAAAHHQHVVKSVEGQPGALPLLADLFTDLWERTNAMPRCWVRAASGHVAAAPPSSVMNSRRFTRSPRRRGRAALAEVRDQEP